MILLIHEPAHGSDLCNVLLHGTRLEARFDESTLSLNLVCCCSSNLDTEYLLSGSTHSMLEEGDLRAQGEHIAKEDNSIKLYANEHSVVHTNTIEYIQQ